MHRSQLRHVLLLAAGTLLLAGCLDEDSATGPTEGDRDLAGTWQFVNTDMADRILEHLVPFLQQLGATEDLIEATQQELVAEIGSEGSFFHPGYAISLDAEHTWQDSVDDAGTWQAGDGLLTVTSSADPATSLCFAYEVTADRLTLELPVSGLVEALRAEGELDQETEMFFSLYFTDDDVFTIVMARQE